jgi:hypothetical protein
MSKWEQYKVEQFQPNQGQQTSKWEQYKIKTLQSQPKEYSVGNRAASAGKAIAAGVGGAIPDTAALAYNIPAALHNALARHNQNLPDEVKQAYEELVAYNPEYANYLNTTEIPTIPSATEAIDRGIDNVTGGYTETPEDQKNLNEGLKFGSSFATGGGIAKVGATLGNKVISKTGNFIGSLEKSQIAGAGAAGATSSYLADQGASAPESIAGGVAANLAVNATPELAKGGGNILTKGVLSLTGLGKKQLNLDAAKAAQDLDIALPKAAASSGKAIALSDQFLSKTPIAGDIMHKRYLKVGDKALKELNDAYDSVVPQDLIPEFNVKSKELYDKAKAVLPEQAQIVPQNTIASMQGIRSKLNEKASLSSGEAKVNSILKDFENMFTPSGINKIPSPTRNIVSSQDSLGNMVNWKDTSIDWSTEATALVWQKELYHSMSKDLAQYGKTNPEWFEFFKGADKLKSKLKKREDLEHLFSSAQNSATDELSYNSLSKILNDNSKKERLKYLVEPEVFTRLEKLGQVAKAMAVKNKNTPNPSGTAATQKTFDIISYLALGYGAATDLLSTGGTIAVGSLTAHLLTDKKSLDLAIKFASSPTKDNAISFSRRMKAITGYTPVTLMREASKLEQEKQADNPNFIEISNPLKKHTEENKKRPKGKALNELLENPYVNGFGKSLSNPWPQK